MAYIAAIVLAAGALFAIILAVVEQWDAKEGKK